MIKQEKVLPEEIEFVARAICELNGIDPECQTVKNFQYFDAFAVVPEFTIPAWKNYTKIARYCILAVRQFNTSDPRIGDD